MFDRYHPPNNYYDLLEKVSFQVIEIPRSTDITYLSFQDYTSTIMARK